MIDKEYVSWLEIIFIITALANSILIHFTWSFASQVSFLKRHIKFRKMYSKSLLEDNKALKNELKILKNKLNNK